MKAGWSNCLLLFCISSVALRCFSQPSGPDSTLLAELQSKAATGDAEFQVDLGIAFERGRLGLSKDPLSAVGLYRKAAEKGNAFAQYMVAHCLAIGRGAPRDEAEAAKWYRKAADQNLPMAEYLLGFIYGHGQGVPTDTGEALKWYQKAADQDLSIAECVLGSQYEHGWGVLKNETEALKWYRKAAAQADPFGQLLVGRCYAAGRGVDKNDFEAFGWYRKAAEQDEPLPQYALGLCYFNGQGVLKDNYEAYKWALLATRQGFNQATQLLTILEKDLPQAQLEAGRNFVNKVRTRVPISPNVLSINGLNDEYSEISGSGFFISQDGYVLTSQHLIRNATRLRLITAVGVLSARKIKSDATEDLALLKAEGRFDSLPLVPNESPPTDTVFAIGFTEMGLQDFAPTITKAALASTSQNDTLLRYIQILADLNPVNMGGALLDQNGNIVGMLSYSRTFQAALNDVTSVSGNVHYAIRSTSLLKFLAPVLDLHRDSKEPQKMDYTLESALQAASRATVLVFAL